MAGESLFDGRSYSNRTPIFSCWITGLFGTTPLQENQLHSTNFTLEQFHPEVGAPLYTVWLPVSSSFKNRNIWWEKSIVPLFYYG